MRLPDSHVSTTMPCVMTHAQLLMLCCVRVRHAARNMHEEHFSWLPPLKIRACSSTTPVTSSSTKRSSTWHWRYSRRRCKAKIRAACWGTDLQKCRYSTELLPKFLNKRHGGMVGGVSFRRYKYGNGCVHCRGNCAFELVTIENCVRWFCIRLSGNCSGVIDGERSVNLV